MACTICNAGRQWHGSGHATPGTHLHETGCHDGVMMDDDVHAEGWQRDVLYPPCPNNPRRCMACDGTGDAGPEVTTQDDCPACDGTGWADGKAEWPTSMADLADDIYARMHKAANAGRGVRLSADEIELLSRTTVGQWMAEAAEKLAARKGARRSATLTPES